MTIFNWIWIVFLVFCFAYDAYSNWERIGVIDKKCQDKKCPKLDYDDGALFRTELCKLHGIEDPFLDYEVITEVEYYDNEKGERQYRTIPLLDNN